ncbi:hypothetical protein ACP70R_003692 [Stipagrostis hirtigluma subsp. patula]
MDFVLQGVHNDESLSSTDIENIPNLHDGNFSVDVKDMDSDSAFKVNEDSSSEHNIKGFRLRLESIFGKLLSARVKEGICELFQSHCQKVPNSHHKQSELLVLNLLQLLKKSFKTSNCCMHENETSSTVSGPYDDIIEFLDEDEVQDSELEAKEFIPDFVDELCDHFFTSLDVNGMNFEPDDEI